MGAVITVAGELRFKPDIPGPPFDAADQMAAGAFAFVKIALGKAGAAKQSPVISDWWAIERGVPVQIVSPADRVVGVQSLACIQTQFRHMMHISEPVQALDAAVTWRTGEHVVGQEFHLSPLLQIHRDVSLLLLQLCI